VAVVRIPLGQLEVFAAEISGNVMEGAYLSQSVATEKMTVTI